MVFSSNVFLFLFLPVFLAIYYASPSRWRNVIILIASYIFYGWWRADFLLLFAGVTAWNYLVGLGIARNGIGTAGAKRWLTAGVVVDLSILGYFKYANFGIDTLNALLGVTGNTPITALHVLLPIGISFYIFHAISYIVDIYRGDVEATQDPIAFAAFIALFPQLVAGPVLRYKDVVDQFANRTHTVEKFAEGATRFMQGFVKKVFIADTLAPIADQAFALENPTMVDSWVGALAYAAQLYFDFSGYSDMAVGLGLMIGFRFMENFNQPYISQSITEFWRRWHISLSNWLRDYLYVPLGGNRHGTLMTYRNLLLTMLLGGIWHGANWTFVVWGLWHGGLLAIERMAGVKAQADGFNVARWSLTFLAVLIGWVIFRAPDIGTAFSYYGAMFSFDSEGLSAPMAAQTSSLQLAVLIVAYIVVAVCGWRASEKPLPLSPRFAAVIAHPITEAMMLPIFALAVLRLSAQSYSPFLYFQF